MKNVAEMKRDRPVATRACTHQMHTVVLVFLAGSCLAAAFLGPVFLVFLFRLGLLLSLSLK